MSKVIMFLGWALMGLGVSITNDNAIIIPAVLVIAGALILISAKEDE